MEFRFRKFLLKFITFPLLEIKTKIKELDKDKEYMVHVGDANHEPDQETLNRIREALSCYKNYNIKIVVPYWIKFEELNKEEKSRIMESLK